MLKHTTIAAALTAILAVPAFAQQQASPPSAGGFVQGQSAGDWRGSKLIGASVYGPDNASIGEIGDLVIAPDGAVRAVVVGVSDKDIAIPFRALKITRGPGDGVIDKVTVNYSKQQLDDAPRFAFDQPADTTTGLGDGSPAATPAR
jgi:PRC-barrel domain